MVIWVFVLILEFGHSKRQIYMFFTNIFTLFLV